ncbi:hypothetical protein AB1N83_009978 [Pleurotus pulmonarius]
MSEMNNSADKQEQIRTHTRTVVPLYSTLSHPESYSTLNPCRREQHASVPSIPSESNLALGLTRNPCCSVRHSVALPWPGWPCTY